MRAGEDCLREGKSKIFKAEGAEDAGTKK